MSKRRVNIAMVGCGFMGRAHSNALNKLNSFFELPIVPVKKILSCRNPVTSEKIAKNFGWEEIEPDWKKAVTAPDIDVVDIATPVHTHAEIALAAFSAGKAVICEKPLSANLEEAILMADAANRLGLPNMCMYNFRSVPAIVLAKEMISEGAVGKIHQWRGAFLQSGLVDPKFPLTWRLRKEAAGYGVLGDLGSHSIDLAHFLVGEISEVSGMLHTYTKSRPIPVKDMGRDSIPTDQMGEVTTDDAAWSLLRFSNGALGVMEATKMATGRLCANRFEVYGSEGGIAFDFMHMNELEYFSMADSPRTRGWRVIHATQPTHPYMKAWWPPGHSIGYEHTFVHAFANFFEAYANGKMPSPTFEDAAKVQATLAAIEESNSSGRWEKVALN